VSVRDLRVQKRERDLVAATHGRGVWILDDIRWIEEMDASVMNKEVHGFPVKPATLWSMYDQVEELGDRTYRAKNPTFGAWFTIHLKNDLKEKEKAVVTINDATGKTVRTFTDSTLKAGINRMVWNLRCNEPVKMNGARTSWWGGSGGPMTAPGEYVAKIAVAGQSVELPFSVRQDPRIGIPAQDLQLKHTTAVSLRELLSEANRMINESDAVLRQLGELQKKLGQANDKATQDLVKEAQQKLNNYRDEVLRRPPPSMGYRQRPRLREEVQELMYTVDGPEARPTTQQLSRVTELEKEVSEARALLQKILAEDIARINERVKDLPQVVTGAAVNN